MEKLKNAIESVKKNEGAQGGTLSDAVEEFNRLLRDFTFAVKGENGSKDAKAKEAAKINAEIKKIKKMFDGLKKYDDGTQLWFRNVSV